MHAQDVWSTAGALAHGLAAGSVGLFAGGMLAEAGILVPYWRSLEAGAFHAWYRANASRLVGFFGPLTWLAGLSSLGSALLSLLAGHPGSPWAVLCASLMLAVVAMFPIYFGPANAAFADGTMSSADTRRALARWAAWHRARTLLSLAALVAAGISCRT